MTRRWPLWLSLMLAQDHVSGIRSCSDRSPAGPGEACARMGTTVEEFLSAEAAS